MREGLNGRPIPGSIGPQRPSRSILYDYGDICQKGGASEATSSSLCVSVADVVTKPVLIGML